MGGDPCQPILDELASLEQQLTEDQALMKGATGSVRADYLKLIKSLAAQTAKKNAELTKCREKNPLPGPKAVPLAVVFTGGAVLNIASGTFPEPIPVDGVTFELLFSSDRTEVSMTSFPPLMVTANGNSVTVTMQSSGTGSFDSTNGEMILPVTFAFGTAIGTYSLEFDDPVMTTEQAPQVERYSPQGMRLNFKTGAIKLVGATRFDGDGDPASLEFDGAISPIPRRVPPFSFQPKT